MPTKKNTAPKKIAKRNPWAAAQRAAADALTAENNALKAQLAEQNLKVIEQKAKDDAEHKAKIREWSEQLSQARSIAKELSGEVTFLRNEVNTLSRQRDQLSAALASQQEVVVALHGVYAEEMTGGDSEPNGKEFAPLKGAAQRLGLPAPKFRGEKQANDLFSGLFEMLAGSTKGPEVLRRIMAGPSLPPEVERILGDSFFIREETPKNSTPKSEA